MYQNYPLALITYKKATRKLYNYKAEVSTVHAHCRTTVSFSHQWYWLYKHIIKATNEKVEIYSFTVGV